MILHRLGRLLGAALLLAPSLALGQTALQQPNVAPSPGVTVDPLPVAFAKLYQNDLFLQNLVASRFTALGGAALLNVGTITGTVADGGSLTAEIARAKAAEGANAGAIATLAQINSPAFTGVPTAPTAAPGTNSTQIANMAAVTAAVATGGQSSVLFTSQTLTGAQQSQARGNIGAAASGANSDITSLNAPALGAATAATAPVGAATSQVANTAFTAAAVATETTRATTAEGTKAAKGANADITSLANLSGILDAGISSSRATIAVRGASTWGGLTPSTSGCTFQFNGSDTVCAAASPGTGAVRYDAAQGLTSGQQAQARGNIAGAASGANSDVTSLSGLTTPLSVAQGGTGGSSASAARSGLGLNAMGAIAFRNRLINGNLAINQRGAASASTAYAAGAYVMDRWKAGSGGVTLSFAAAANGDVTATITAGTLVQVIEGSLYLPEGGAYVLSWTGTATARIAQGAGVTSYGPSPVSTSSLTAGTNATVEFATGTFTLAQFEPGSVPTLFERRDDEIRRAQRYFETGTLAALGYASGAGGPVGQYIVFHVPKRATGATVTSGTASISANAASGTIDNVTIDGFRYFAGATAAGSVAVVAPYSAASEL